MHTKGPPRYAVPNDASSSRRSEVNVLAISDAIAALNKQFLDSLVQRARDVNANFPLDGSLRATIANLSCDERHQAAQCGVFLVDVGFADLAGWQNVAPQLDKGQMSEDVRSGLVSEESIVLAYAALMVAWYVVHANPAVASALCGMSEPVVAIYRAMGIGELALIARHRTHWVQPRWHDRLDIWSSIVGCATNARTQELMPVILRCLKASAARSPRLLAAIDDSL